MQVFSDDKRYGSFSNSYSVILASDYVPLVNLLGLYYQIRDDFLNLQSGEYQKHKSFAEDISEGKFSFPIIHAIRTQPADHRLLHILKRRTEDMDVKTHAIQHMEAAGSFQYTRETLAKLSADIHAQIEELGGNERLSELVHLLEKIQY